MTVLRAETAINVTGGLAELASVMGSAASRFGILWSGRPTVLLAPAVAAECARRGMDRGRRGVSYGSAGAGGARTGRNLGWPGAS